MNTTRRKGHGYWNMSSLLAWWRSFRRNGDSSRKQRSVFVRRGRRPLEERDQENQRRKEGTEGYAEEITVNRSVPHLRTGLVVSLTHVMNHCLQKVAERLNFFSISTASLIDQSVDPQGPPGLLKTRLLLKMGQCTQNNEFTVR